MLLKHRLLVLALLIVSSLAINQDISAQVVKTEISDALMRGDTTKAIDMINVEIGYDKGYYYYYFMLGDIYFTQGKFEQALEQLLLSVDKKKKYSPAQYMLGRTYLKLGDIENAEEVMTKQLKKAKKEDKHFFNNGVGLVMMAKGDYQSADKSFRKAIQSKSGESEYHINLGDANFYSGVPYLAISEYKKALELDTAGLEVYYHWAEACLETKDYNCAIEKLKIVLSKDSTYANAWRRAGGIYFKAALSSRKRSERSSRFKETIGSYKKYLDLSGAQPDSSSVRAYLELALSYQNLNLYEDAVGYFDKVLAIPYELRDIYFNYGKSLWGSKKFVEASEMFLKHLDWVDRQGSDYVTGISSEELYRLMGDSYYYRSSKDYLNAAKYYILALETTRQKERLLKNIAMSYHQLKSYQQAIEYYDKRIKLGIDSTTASIYRNAGYCALNLANNSEDDDMMDEEDMEDEEMEEEIIPASAVDQTDYLTLALTYMQKFLEYKPNDSKVLLLVASSYLYQLNDCVKGVEFYEKILAMDANNCDAQKAIGYAYFGGICTKNYPKAIRYLKKAYSCIVSAGDSCDDVDLMIWVAQCYHLIAADKQAKKADSNDDFKNAFKWYGKVLKCEPGNSDAKKGQDDTRFEFYDKDDKAGK